MIKELLVVSFCITGFLDIVLLNFGIWREEEDLLIYVKESLKGLKMLTRKQ